MRPGFIVAVIALIFLGVGIINTNRKNVLEKPEVEYENHDVATFAGGCFWCIEAAFEAVEGVIEAVSGYTGGLLENPTYEQVSSGKTSHLEAVQVLYDPQKVSYEELLEVFWRNIDPTDNRGQFADKGPQYRTAIFCHDEEQRILAEKSKGELENSGIFDNPIVTEIRSYTVFYPAEEYHQDYYKKNVLRYESYKKLSGREGFIEKTWKDNEEQP